MKFNSVLSPYGSLVFVLRNFCLSRGCKFFLLCFLQETVIALDFTIQSMTHFDLLLRYVWDKNARLFTHLCMSSVPAAFVEKASLLTRLMKDYYPKGTKNLKCSNKKTTQFFLKKVKRPWHTPHRRAYRWRISTWRVFHMTRHQGMQIKMTRYRCRSLEWPKSRVLTPLNTRQDVEQQELSPIAGGDAAALRTAGWFLTQLNRLLHMIPPSQSLVFTKMSWELTSTQRPAHRIDAYSSFIHNCSNPKTTKMPFSSEWVNKLAHPDGGIWFSTEKKWATWRSFKCTLPSERTPSEKATVLPTTWHGEDITVELAEGSMDSRGRTERQPGHLGSHSLAHSCLVMFLWASTSHGQGLGTRQRRVISSQVLLEG